MKDVVVLDTNLMVLLIVGTASRSYIGKHKRLAGYTVDIDGARRQEFAELGITDAVILHFCTLDVTGVGPTLLTADTRLADRAHSLGF